MIGLITPTGARQKQIDLCAQFMKNQDYQGEVIWILVDDAIPITIGNITDPFKPNWTIVKMFPRPVWKEGKNTQGRNLLIGIEEIKKYPVDSIFIIEDDDYYSPQYLRVMTEKLQGYVVAGQKYTVYYHVGGWGWMRNGNDIHASLFQTAFTPSAIPVFEKVCQRYPAFIDMAFFKAMEGKKIHLFDGKDLAIGIKGIPGRKGIGKGHRMEIKMTPDPEKETLKELIGDDYKYYV